MRKNIAIILARGGSKGIPRKNLLNFCGVPLVQLTILQAMNTPEIDEVVLSSDSEEILEIGRANGITVIVRPADLADDHATSESAVLHAIDQLGLDDETILMLEPTAPLRKLDDLSKAIRLFDKQGFDSAFSGAALEDFLIWKRGDDGALQSVNYDYMNQGPRQLRKPDYVENGAIYIFRAPILREHNNRFGGTIGIIPNEFWQSFEIDSPDDWSFVELLFKQYLIDEYSSLLKKGEI